MIKMIITLVTIMNIWLFSGLDWLETIITAHNLANLALLILGILIASAASQLRLVLEKIENILLQKNKIFCLYNSLNKYYDYLKILYLKSVNAELRRLLRCYMPIVFRQY